MKMSNMLDDKSCILVPYDGTELSLKALGKAEELGQKFNSRIIILYVIDDRSVYPEEIQKFVTRIHDLENLKEQFVNIIRESVVSMLKERADRLKENGLNVDFIIRIGSPGDEILAVAADNDADMIVMGTSGSLRRRQAKRGLGSISRWVTEMASCPVVLIR
jgi:nucleotide-binding universal stress UspA family protein